jgi:hypothetical protein
MLVLALAASLPASAAVVSTGANGFVVRHEVAFEGTPAQAWDRIGTPGAWWSPKHTYSGDAKNLSLTLRPGGCWCEDLGNGGFVQHMQVVFVRAPATLRLVGGLGPLQALGASGALTFEIKADGGATKVSAVYAVSGYGVEKRAEAGDGVLGGEVARRAGCR